MDRASRKPAATVTRPSKPCAGRPVAGPATPAAPPPGAAPAAAAGGAGRQIRHLFWVDQARTHAAPSGPRATRGRTRTTTTAAGANTACGPASAACDAASRTRADVLRPAGAVVLTRFLRQRVQALAGAKARPLAWALALLPMPGLRKARHGRDTAQVGEPVRQMPGTH